MSAGSNSSFYNQNQTVYTDTNPAGPVEQTSQTTNTGSPSSFFQDGTSYEALANWDTVQATMNTLLSETQTAATNGQASATAAASSATSAASSASAASASQTAAGTSATNASNSATAAANSATSASSSASTATTQATSSTSAASASASSASNASSSASAAATSASNASGSASAAATSATNASGSASAAATSATNAAASASSAAWASNGSTALPAMDGTGAAGTAAAWAHGDHVHPTDTSRAPVASPAFTGTPTAPTPSAGDNSTKLATTAFVLANSVGNNLLINPEFRINQRAYVSGAALASGSYGHDRWKAGASGGAYSFTQLASSTQVTISSGDSLIQVVENNRVLLGGSYTLSWTGTAQARVAVNSATPSGSFASSPITVSGQTVGTTMSVEFNSGTLSNAKLEAGSSSTQFVSRDFSLELMLCMRYCEPIGVGFSGVAFSTTAASLTGDFKVQKRATPTATLVNGTNAIATPGVGGFTVTGITSNNSDVYGGYFVVSASGLTSGAFVLGFLNPGAILATCEL